MKRCCLTALLLTLLLAADTPDPDRDRGAAPGSSRLAPVPCGSSTPSFPSAQHGQGALPGSGGKGVRLVLLARMNGSRMPGAIPPEGQAVERDLCYLLRGRLRQAFQDRGEVAVVPVNQVERYKDTLPGWGLVEPDLRAVGRHFAADYVVALHVRSWQLYEPESGKGLFRGRAAVFLSVHDMNAPDEDPVCEEECVHVFPKSGVPIVADEIAVWQFRRAFLSHLAQELSSLLTNSPGISTAPVPAPLPDPLLNSQAR